MGSPDPKLIALCAAPMHGLARVLHVDENGACHIRQEGGSGEHRARRAVSCLVMPQAGDTVWLAGDLSHGLYVTAVLERDPHSGSRGGRVVLPADARVESANGRMTLHAESLKLDSQDLAVQARSAAVAVDKITGIGREVTWSFQRVKLIADALETFADRLLQVAGWSQRTVTGVDQVRARHIDYRAEEMMQLQAQNLVANAANLVKLDGEQIHMG